MLTVKNITKEYNNIEILKNITFAVKDTDRIGLIGDNGCGKSTLLKIISGNEQADLGSVDTENNTFGYLSQNPVFENITIGNYLQKILSENTHEKLALPHTLEQLDLTSIDSNTQCNLLSGGQKTKLSLATLLLQKPQPTMLLLDEPTNNLDLPSLDWLENFLLTFIGSILLVSHDRYFLNKICNKIFELKDGELKTYGGNYSFYKKQREIEEQAYEKTYETQQKKIKKTLENIENLKNEAQIYEDKFTSRNPYQKKKAAKSVRGAVVKEKKLEKLIASTEYLDKPAYKKDYGVDIYGTNPQGKMILVVNKLSFSFTDQPLFKNVSFDLFGTERLWLKGKNGSGKTTIIKILQGQLNSISGDYKFGKDVKVGYFSQDASSLRDNFTGIEELTCVNTDTTECFRMAVHLHLTQEDLHKQISKLSSGQKVKLEFAKLLLANTNLLILDEPTNHLEISTREDIEEALEDYKGAILIVSHDRYLVEKLKINEAVTLA